MKNVLLFICVFLTVNVFGQSKDTMQVKSERNIGVSVKKLFADYKGINEGDFGTLDNFGDGYEIAYLNRITERLEIVVPFQVGVFSFADSITNNAHVGLGAGANYYFAGNDKFVQPYANAVIKGVFVRYGDFFANLPIGAGLDFNIHKSTALNLQLNYEIGLSEDRSAFSATLGFKHYFMPKQMKKDTPKVEMPKDSDGDGIIDDLDLCPSEKGLVEFDGCPDRDGDSIPDIKDSCPDFAGLKEFNGCPDTDGDGISDNDDQCPKIAGPKENNGCPDQDSDDDGVIDAKDNCPEIPGEVNTMGCPDADKDGVADKDDKCPNEAGLPSNSGCPDTDGDGVIDPEDLCPNSAGPASNRGCPEIKKEERDVLEFAMEAVEFETGRATLKPSSYSTLNDIAEILNKYPNYNLRISGHTDNVGSDVSNQLLSEQRARSCYEYLASKGISTSRMSYVGFGESKPRSNNDTEAGRKRNRRVEFDLFLGN